MKTRGSKGRKIEIFPKGLTHGFGKKISHFSIFLFLGNRDHENTFYAIPDRKNTFLGYKNNRFNNSKHWDFSKRENRWFWAKIGNFSIFLFLGNRAKENVFYDILDQKNAFPIYKNKKFKKSKKLTFFQRG